MSILAIDYGRKRIGLAALILSVPIPLTPIVRAGDRQVFSSLKKTAEEYSISEIVLGLPLNMDNTESEMSREVRGFAVKLENKLKIPVKFINEGLTSMEAEQELKFVEKDWKKRKLKIDSVAAVYILRTYMEHRNAETQ